MATRKRRSGSFPSTSSPASSPPANGRTSPQASSSASAPSTCSSRTFTAPAGSSPPPTLSLGDFPAPPRTPANKRTPADIVLGNSQYCIPVAGARAPHGVYAHICGIDLVRTGPDDFFVLEDNARTPSGVSYMLENREAMLRLCPELFDALPVEPVDSYPELLRETLQSVSPRPGDACCVLLTPGHFNSAFYEHSFLADNMGIELVEGSDLEVDDDVVWMRTIHGRKRVDVIYRRI